jgi:hypothetical protein
MIMRRPLVFAGILAAAAPQAGPAQDTTVAERTFILEGRLGVSDGLGGRSGALLNPTAMTGVSLAFHLSRHWWGWASADYQSDLGSTSRLYMDSRVRPPALELYTLTAGVARRVGLPFLPSHWRPFEIGVGIGATQSEIQTMANTSGNTVFTRDRFPPDAEFESVFGTGLWSSTRWLPTTAARLRMAAPLGPLRLSLTTGITATYVGDVQLWDGGWEPTGEGTRYRPTSTVWSYGTLLTVPLSVGLGFRF